MNTLSDRLQELREQGIYPDLIYKNMDEFGKTGIAYYFNIKDLNVAVWFPDISLQVFSPPRKDATKRENMFVVMDNSAILKEN